MFARCSRYCYQESEFNCNTLNCKAFVSHNDVVARMTTSTHVDLNLMYDL